MNAIEKLMGNGRDSFVAFPEAELPERERNILSDPDMTGSWWFDYGDAVMSEYVDRSRPYFRYDPSRYYDGVNRVVTVSARGDVTTTVSSVGRTESTSTTEVGDSAGIDWDYVSSRLTDHGTFAETRTAVSCTGPSDGC